MKVLLKFLTKYCLFLDYLVMENNKFWIFFAISLVYFLTNLILHDVVTGSTFGKFQGIVKAYDLVTQVNFFNSIFNLKKNNY